MGVEYWIIASWALTNLIVLVLAHRLGKDIRSLYGEVQQIAESLRRMRAEHELAEVEPIPVGQLSAASGQ
jgi:hypothetical protein